MNARYSGPDNPEPTNPRVDSKLLIDSAEVPPASSVPSPPKNFSSNRRTPILHELLPVRDKSSFKDSFQSVSSILENFRLPYDSEERQSGTLNPDHLLSNLGSDASAHGSYIHKIEDTLKRSDLSATNAVLNRVLNICPPEWTAAPILFHLLESIDRLDLTTNFMKHGITDLWFPFQKHMLRHFFNDPEAQKAFLEAQSFVLSHTWPSPRNHHIFHLAFEDGDEVVEIDRLLGEGGCGTVDQITISTQPHPTVCVRKRIGRTSLLNKQKKIMEAFRREINVMRQVHHHHCVSFIGSYTDHDSVALLCSPVADMDLAQFLDKPFLDEHQLDVLRRGIGCLCVAVLYLHEKKIRHEDLKPQNVLIHGTNILLTDFGFSLDFSEDSVSTTTGTPSHLTARYSAPEIMKHEARNRATDIWSLGCVILEMLSRLHGHTLSSIKTFWKDNGSHRPSFSMNRKTAELWFQRIYDDTQQYPKESYLVLLIHTMQRYRSKRLLRPSAKQIVEKLAELESMFPSGGTWFGMCCADHMKASIPKTIQDEVGLDGREVKYFYPHLFDDVAYIYADLDFTILKHRHVPGHNSLREIFDSSVLESVLDCILELSQRLNHDIASPQYFIRKHKNGRSIAKWSFLVSPIKHIIHLRKRCSLTCFTPRAVQFSIVPICFPRCELYGSFFLVVTFLYDATHDSKLYSA
ncbi:kinase-like protein [Zopfia rhizophila CBS 207.26]|uniref:Kinase-like protein n=1 Tax=Zopfia rhizophila CBS 207.26 TaxID=1314779 RepID=A0A6A6EET5_9PEZI|nr:kinase-like protein [Zopfia rhizophila CBS 207.26]